MNSLLEFRENEGTFYDGEFICDFNIEVVDKNTLKTSSTAQEEKRYQLKTTYTDGRNPVTKWITDPRNIDYFKLFEVNDSFLTSKSRTLLTNKLLAEITRLPQKMTIVVSSGYYAVFQFQISDFNG